jgi:pimeloyl-ACP methyl ester carboxylesterase
MDNSMPTLLIPRLVSSPRIYAPVMPALWRCGPVPVANHIRDDNMGAIARRILAEAPPRFALAGHSMGGYIAFKIMRQAPDRVAPLALIKTQARPDTSEAIERRRGMMARVKGGGYRKVLDELFPGFVHPAPRGRKPAPARLRHGRGCRGQSLHPPADRGHQPARLAPGAGVDQISDPGAVGRPGQQHFRIRFRSKWPATFPTPNW